MSSAHQINTVLRSTVNLILLASISASFASACVSSSDNNATGGSSNGGESSTAAGGSTSTDTATGGAANVTACNLDAGLATGNVCAVNPPIFALDPTSCSFGDWNMSSNVLSGGLAIWGGLAQDCTGGVYHVTGGYDGALVANSGGNAGFNTFYNVPTATDVGCSIVDASNYQGLTLTINNVTIPNNQFIVGMNFADGNSAETTLTLVAGEQTKQIPWGAFTKKHVCGPPTGSNITTIYYVFLWLNDAATHAVDATFSNIGFY